MIPLARTSAKSLLVLGGVLLLNGPMLLAQGWVPAGGITTENAAVTVSAIPPEIRAPLKKFVVAWEVSGMAENDPAVVDCKNGLRTLGVECGFKAELLSIIRDAQSKAIQLGDPKGFLAAEDQYGWKALVVLNIVAEEKFNQFLAAPITNLTIGVNCQGLRGEPLSKFEVTRSVKGKGKQAAIQDVLRDCKDAMVAKIYADICLKAGAGK